MAQKRRMPSAKGFDSFVETSYVEVSHGDPEGPEPSGEGTLRVHALRWPGGHLKRLPPGTNFGGDPPH